MVIVKAVLFIVIVLHSCYLLYLVFNKGTVADKPFYLLSFIFDVFLTYLIATTNAT